MEKIEILHEDKKYLIQYGKEEDTGLNFLQVYNKKEKNYMVISSSSAYLRSIKIYNEEIKSFDVIDKCIFKTYASYYKKNKLIKHYEYIVKDSNKVMSGIKLYENYDKMECISEDPYKGGKKYSIYLNRFLYCDGFNIFTYKYVNLNTIKQIRSFLQKLPMEYIVSMYMQDLASKQVRKFLTMFFELDSIVRFYTDKDYYNQYIDSKVMEFIDYSKEIITINNKNLLQLKKIYDNI